MLLMTTPQVRKLEGQFRSAKEAMDADVRQTASKAEKIATEVTAMRSVVSNCLQESQERVRQVQSEYEALQRTCDAEVARLQKDLNAALEAILNHKLHIRKTVETVMGSARTVGSEVEALRVPTLSGLAQS